MIFTPEHVQKIFDGRKTQTRRLARVNDDWTWGAGVGERWGYLDEYKSLVAVPMSDFSQAAVHTVARGGRTKWQVGRTYAVQAGRNLPTAMWRRMDDGGLQLVTDDIHSRLLGDGWKPLRIRITDIRQERLQEINDEEAAAEIGLDTTTWRDYQGLLPAPRELFAETWDSIHKTRGTRWAASPWVWALTFELADL